MGRKGSLAWSVGGGKVDTSSAEFCAPEKAVLAVLAASTLFDPVTPWAVGSDSVGFFLKYCRAME